MRLFPKNGIFFDLFEKQAEKLTEAGKVLKDLVENNHKLDEIAEKMKQLEEEADNIGHNVVDHLRTSFITPLEGEDIDILRQEMDNIMDKIERAVNRIVIYKIPEPLPKEIREYAEILEKAILEITKAAKEIRNVRKFHEDIHYRCKKLNELENTGDEINRTALKNLMNVKNTSPEKNLEIIKLKEIYETLEEAIDSCEDVGNILESIAIKNR